MNPNHNSPMKRSPSNRADEGSPSKRSKSHIDNIDDFGKLFILFSAYELNRQQ
jgi:hypothetical protein